MVTLEWRVCEVERNQQSPKVCFMLCQSALHYCHQNARQEQLREGVIYLGSKFQGFRSLVGQLHCSRPEARQSITVEERGERKLRARGSQEAEGKRKGQTQSPRACPSDFVLHPCPCLLVPPPWSIQPSPHSPTDEARALLVQSLPRSPALDAAAWGARPRHTSSWGRSRPRPGCVSSPWSGWTGSVSVGLRGDPDSWQRQLRIGEVKRVAKIQPQRRPVGQLNSAPQAGSGGGTPWRVLGCMCELCRQLGVGCWQAAHRPQQDSPTRAARESEREMEAGRGVPPSLRKPPRSCLALTARNQGKSGAEPWKGGVDVENETGEERLCGRAAAASRKG